MIDIGLDKAAMTRFLVCRDLEKQEKDLREKEKEARRRQERKHRDLFKDLLKRHLEEGLILPKMRWKVSSFTCSELNRQVEWVEDAQTLN